MAGCVINKPIQRQTYPRAEQPIQLRRTRLAFFALCCYLASQAIGIPVIAFGPSWAVWPTLSDIAIGIMAVCAINGYRRYRVTSKANNEIFQGLLLVLGGSVLAFFFIYMRNTITSIGGSDKSMSIGMFQIYHLTQFVFVFWVTAGIPLPESRLKLLSRIVDIVLLIVFAGVLGTYFSVINTRQLVSHLPAMSTATGPWSALYNRQMSEIGLVGYNHAYTALQLIMLAALALHLKPKSGPFIESMYLLMCMIGVVASGSRAGMASAAIFIAAHLIRKPGTLITIFIVSIVLSITAGGVLLQNQDINMEETIGRLMSLQRPTEPEALSGRQEIWKESYSFIQEDPLRWLIGAGPGSVAQQGYNAHMLYMQIVMEAGLIGLIIFILIFVKVIKYLNRIEEGTKPILFATLVFLISSFTQETFYPVPALGHFLGLYLCSLAIALRFNPNRDVHTQPNTEVRNK